MAVQNAGTPNKLAVPFHVSHPTDEPQQFLRQMNSPAEIPDCRTMALDTADRSLHYLQTPRELLQLTLNRRYASNVLVDSWRRMYEDNEAGLDHCTVVSTLHTV